MNNSQIRELMKNEVNPLSRLAEYISCEFSDLLKKEHNKYCFEVSKDLFGFVEDLRNGQIKVPARLQRFADIYLESVSLMGRIDQFSCEFPEIKNLNN